MENRTRQKDQLVADVRQVIGELETLLRDTASDAGSDAAGLKDRLADRLRSARATLGDLEYQFSDRAREAARLTSERAMEAARLTSERAREAARFTDDYVHDHPWAVVGIAAGIGALIALILSRR